MSYLQGCSLNSKLTIENKKREYSTVNETEKRKKTIKLEGR